MSSKPAWVQNETCIKQKKERKKRGGRGEGREEERNEGGRREGERGIESLSSSFLKFQLIIQLM